MTDMQRRRNEGRRGDVDDQLVGEVSTEGIPRQLRGRRAMSWRLPPLEFGLRDPLDPAPPDDWTPGELESWAAAAAHLRLLNLPAVVPESARTAWRRRSCPCRGVA